MQVNSGTTTPVECLICELVGEVPQHLSAQAYTVLVLNIIILAVTCPFTVLLNLLTIIAVKMKARLQRMSNIALACLATTDLLVGFLGQPLFISFAISVLQCKSTTEVRRLQNSVKYPLNFFSFSSLVHLVLMSADRYLAIKQSYNYEKTVTKTRVLIASAIAWMFSLAVLILHFVDDDLFISTQNLLGLLLMVLIAFCSVVVYCEARRHEREILTQQVSVEAKERFLKERRALRLTITVVVMVFLNYLPLISLRAIRRSFKDKVSLGTIYAVYFPAVSLAVLNSFINPLIYSVRLRQFRVAFIEILLKKNYAEAEEFEMRLFGSQNAVLNSAVPSKGGEGEQNVDHVIANIDIETNQGGEREEENVIQVNANIDIEANQGGEREDENVNQVQVNANIDIETNQGGERRGNCQKSECVH